MSFKLRNKVITLDNYKEVFHECTPDILDEIRSAILDDTPIAKFIEPCGVDNYKLGQIRMALRELVPIEYISVKLTGKTIHNIRLGIAKGYDMSSLLKYIGKNNLLVDDTVLEELSEFLYLGVDIEKVDFTVVKSDLVHVICQGLLKGYPMWLCIGGNIPLTEKYLRLLMRGMQLEVDIYPFINTEWSESQLVTIFSHAKSVNINAFVSYISNKFDVDCIDTLVKLYQKNIPISSLCYVDDTGEPIYNSYQMYELGLALEDGTITNEMYNAKLSDMEIADLHRRELEKKNKKLSVTL